MLLNNPSFGPTDLIKKKFQQLRQNKNIPTEVNCVVFKSRDEADHWIQLRHEGQQDGRGTKSWNAPQITRYAEKRGRKNPNIQAIKLLDFAVRQNIISPDELVNYSITTLQRYLSNPLVRNVFGLENKQDLSSKHDIQTFEKLVKKFLADAAAGKDISSRSKGDDWRAYANKIQREITDPPPETNPVVDYGANKKEADPLPKKPLMEKSKQDPVKRKYIISYDVKFSINDKILNRVYQEMRKLEVEGYEFCSAYLIRAFIERTIILYMEKHLPEELLKQSKLHTKILKTAEHLEKSGVKKTKLQALSVAASDANAMLSPFILGSMIHLSVIPTKRELLNIWDRLESVLKIIHQDLK
jgi:hypothetical protein